MPRPSNIPQEKKDEARRLLRVGGMSKRAIAIQTGMSEMTVAGIEKALKAEQNPNGGASEPAALTTKQLLDMEKEKSTTLEFQLTLETLKNKHLRRYAKAGDPFQKNEIEVRYLLARAELFGDAWVKRLSEEEDEENEDEKDGAGESRA
jgi:hypothetical protein